jgi:DNA-binding response OmpR family regulator
MKIHKLARYDVVMDSFMPRVLVIDDEDAIRELLEYGLSRAGFASRSVGNGRDALKAITQWTPEAIILDVMLPHVDGYALLPMMRRITDVPILMLSAKSSPPEKVAGLIRGADDYVGKPFDMDELLARIHAMLRRPRLNATKVLHYADLTLDLARHAVRRGTGDIELSQREFDLLHTLMQHSAHVVTREQLFDLVWGANSDVGSSTIDTYVSYLRAKVDTGFERKLIHTVRGVGYMLRDSPP